MNARPRYAAASLLCLLSACATPPAPPPVLPVLPVSAWPTSAPPTVKAQVLQGDAAEALLRAAPTPEQKLRGEDLAQGAMFMAYSCAYALCLGGPMLVGIGKTHLMMVLPPLTARLEAVASDPSGPLARGLEQRLGAQSPPPDAATVRLDSVLLLEGFAPDSVCLALRTRVEIEEGGNPLYREFISVGGPLATAGTPKARCRSVKQWMANDATALTEAIQTYADAIPALLREALPGWVLPP